MRVDYRILPGDIARLFRAQEARIRAEELTSQGASTLRERLSLYHDEAVALQSTDSVPIAPFCLARIDEIQKICDNLKLQQAKS